MSQLTRYGFSREAGRQHIPVPLVRRPSMGAMRIDKGWWPSLPAPSSCMADMGSDWPDAPLPDDIHSPAGEEGKPDSASGLEGLAPEGTSGAPAGLVVQRDPANADQSCIDFQPIEAGGCAPPVLIAPDPEPVRQFPDPPAAAPVAQPDPLPEAAPPVPSAVAAPEVVSGRAAADGAIVTEAEPATYGEIRKAPKIDFARVAAAARARGGQAGPVPRKAPTRHAMSPDPCGRCGVPGWRGCDHQLPYPDYVPAAERGDKAGRPDGRGRYPGMGGL